MARNLNKSARIVVGQNMRAINKILRENYGLWIGYSNNRRLLIRKKGWCNWAKREADIMQAVMNDWQLVDVLENGYVRAGNTGSSGWCEAAMVVRIADEHLMEIKKHAMISKLSV